MNIISGIAKKVNLSVPAGVCVRPTIGRVRESLFNSLGNFVGAGILDLCSGSGALGLEAASRGAKWVTMVEKNSQTCSVIDENMKRTIACGVNTAFSILNCDCLNTDNYLLKLPGKPDFVFADPPYDISTEIFFALLNNIAFVEAVSGALIVWEIPDYPGARGDFISVIGLRQLFIRRFCGTDFTIGRLN